MSILIKGVDMPADGMILMCISSSGIVSSYDGEVLDEAVAIPAAEERPVVRGEWEKTEDFDEYGGGRYAEWTCSVCFYKAKGDWAVRDKHIDEPPAWNFCPNCGADMREEVNNE